MYSPSRKAWSTTLLSWILTCILFSSCVWASPSVEFLRACLNGDLAVVETMLENEGPTLLNQVDKEKNTPLHLACCAKKGGNKKELIAFLVRQGCAINAKNRHSSTPFLIALSTANEEGVKILLLQENLNPNLADHKSYTPLHYATLNQDIEAMKQILSHPKTNPNSGTADGATPLHFAAMHGLTEEVQLLLSDSRINPDARQTGSEYVGATPLHFAALQAQAEITSLLLEKHVDVNAVITEGHFSGFTPTHLCVMNPDIEGVFKTVKLLFLAGANLKAKAHSGQIPQDLTNVGVIRQFLQSPNKDVQLKHKNSP